MLLFADENIPLTAILALRSAGHDVLAGSEAMPRASDPEVLARAGAEGRLLVTFDRDFGALAIEQALPAPAGILLLRFVPVTPAETAAVLLDLFGDTLFVFNGRFTVVNRERVRQRKL